MRPGPTGEPLDFRRLLVCDVEALERPAGAIVHAYSLLLAFAYRHPEAPLTSGAQITLN